jgi:hypothetical protein
VGLNLGFIGLSYVGPSTLTIYFDSIAQKTFTLSKGSGPIMISISDNEYTIARITTKDAEGAVTQDQFTWTVDNPAIVTLTQDPMNPEVCAIAATQPPTLGSAVVTATDTTTPTLPPIVINVTVGAGPSTAATVTNDPPATLPVPPFTA